MVEMALVLPILLFLVLGIVDFGRVMNYWNNVNQIASDAARFAAVNRNPGDDMTPPIPDFLQYVRSQAETTELREGVVAGGDPANCPDPLNTDECSQSIPEELKVCVNSPNGQPLTVGHPIRVQVQSSYNLIGFLGLETGFLSLALKGEAVMRLEQNYTGATATDCPT